MHDDDDDNDDDNDSAPRIVRSMHGGAFPPTEAAANQADKHEVYTVGYGAVGTGHVCAAQPTRVRVPPAARVCAGLDCAAAVCTDGSVHAWGINRDARLGGDAPRHVHTPVRVPLGMHAAAACLGPALVALGS